MKLMASSVSSMNSFRLSQPPQPSFPFHSSSSCGQKKPGVTAAELSLSDYVRPAEDGGGGDDGRDDSRSEAAAPDDMELSIFDARKYYTETSIEPILSTATKISPSVMRFSPASSVDGFSRNYRTGSFRSYATPTASSEASWNSHTGLLTKPPGTVSVSLRDPMSDRKSRLRSDSSRWLLFRRKCPCSSKKSVQVEEISPEPRPLAGRNKFSPKWGAAAASRIKVEDSMGKVSLRPESFMEKRQNMVPNAHRRFSNGGFTFPLLEPSISSSSLPPTTKLLIHGLPPKSASAATASLPTKLTNDPARDSIEVFRPSADPSDFRRKSREVIAYPTSPRRRMDALSINDDAASDASSDLFEIESFSTQSNSTSFPATYGRPRDSLDEARPRFSSAAAAAGGIYGCLDGQSAASAYYAATECGYEPSEASVTWSVTTAEGTAFDHASVTNYSVSASDVEEFARIQLRQHRELERSNGKDKRRGGGLLTSCRC